VKRWIEDACIGPGGNDYGRVKPQETLEKVLKGRLNLDKVPQDNCPKCGRGQFGGPRYVEGERYHCVGHPPMEHLHLTCGTCGYQIASMCNDAEESR
jgi:hypothetical protein